MQRLVMFLGALALSGCSVTPNLAGDKIAVFPVAPDAPQAWMAVGVAGDMPASNWLDQFNDADMLALVAEALLANPSLRSQYYVVAATRAQARSAAGRALPNVSLSASAGATSTYFETGLSDARSTDPSFGLGADLSWEVDLWGRVRAGVDASEADLIASEADLEAARLSVASQAAIAWIDLNEALAQERVAVATYEARASALDLTERRFSRGLTDALDVRTARATLAAAEAAIAARRQASGNAIRRLEVLLGRYPEAAIRAEAVLPTLDPIRAGGTPLLLLARRPDIAAAEARVTAAGLRAEQARLALLPALRLTGTVANSEDDFVDALDPTRLAARLIAGLSAPVFNGGSLQADRDAAIARARSAVEQYAGAALTAWREVEDALAADTLLAQQEDAQKRSLDEATFAEDLATRQYTNGLVSIFNLIDSQTRRLTAESNLIAAQSARASNRVRYHLALGGGLPIENAVEPDLAGTQNTQEANLQ